MGTLEAYNYDIFSADGNKKGTVGSVRYVRWEKGGRITQQKMWKKKVTQKDCRFTSKITTLEHEEHKSLKKKLTNSMWWN